ncbi:thioesterase II family protein [Streptomyces sp. NPDC059740]|uniref:thioesterase II family protein n=1 Tax=Streptomyces sp. NPDC059740 TaxID=3346926 RepID=UPI00365961E6
MTVTPAHQDSPPRAIRRLTPEQEAAGPAVLCFPHAGGSASFFRPWRTLPGTPRLHAVQYPGREDRFAEDPPATLPDLARTLAAEILAGPERYPVFFGHSMGAYVAFEVAHLLEQAGAPVTTLVVSSAAAPASRPPVPFEHSADVLAYLEGYEPVTPEIREDEELLELVLDCLKGDLRLVAHYREHAGKQVTSRLVAVVGEDDVPGIRDGVPQWQQHTRGEFVLLTRPGGHFYLRTDPPVPLLAREAAQHAAAPRTSRWDAG